MKKGDIVEIYEQPLTETKLEGKAKLISLRGENRGGNVGLEFWRVKFLSDGLICDRAIKAK